MSVNSQRMRRRGSEGLVGPRVTMLAFHIVLCGLGTSTDGRFACNSCSGMHVVVFECIDGTMVIDRTARVTVSPQTGFTLETIDDSWVCLSNPHAGGPTKLTVLHSSVSCLHLLLLASSMIICILRILLCLHDDHPPSPHDSPLANTASYPNSHAP